MIKYKQSNSGTCIQYVLIYYKADKIHYNFKVCVLFDFNSINEIPLPLRCNCAYLLRISLSILFKTEQFKR